MLVTEHELEVPLDHGHPDGAKITVVARVVADPDGADKPFLVYFEGGPGYQAPRPTRVPTNPGWLDRALKEFRVLMLLAPHRLEHFRADSIVRDAEAFRQELGVDRRRLARRPARRRGRDRVRPQPDLCRLHEACYADGGATRWSAERLRPEDLELTGEHVYPWMFEEYGALARYARRPTRSPRRSGLRLYDEQQLRQNEVPAAAIIYADDMYVERAFSERTAALIKGLRPWVSNEYEHNGLRVDGERILGRLIDLARGRA